MRVHVFLFLQILFSFTIQTFSQQDLEHISKSLVKIRVNKTEKLSIDSTSNVQFDFSYGTGFYISANGLILTAYHVIEKMSSLNKTPISGYDLELKKSFGLILVFIDKENDIALLQNPYYTRKGVEKEYFINIKKYSRSLNAKTVTTCIGFPNCIQEFGQIFSISMGHLIKTQANLEGYKNTKWKENIVITTNEVVSGFSGGIAFDDNKKPLGIILATGINKKEVQTYIKDFETIVNILKEYEEFL